MLRTYSFSILAGLALAYCVIVALAFAALGAYATAGNVSAIAFFARLLTHGYPFSIAFLSLPYACGIVCAYILSTHADRVQRARNAAFLRHTDRVLSGMHNTFVARCAAIQRGELDHVSPDLAADILADRYPYATHPTPRAFAPMPGFKHILARRTGTNTYAV